LEADRLKGMRMAAFDNSDTERCLDRLVIESLF
jgi:hypothetical protein